jgi:hypothetical protein
LERHGQKKQEIVDLLEGLGGSWKHRNLLARDDAMLQPTRTILYDTCVVETRFTRLSRIKRQANIARKIGFVFSFSPSPETLRTDFLEAGRHPFIHPYMIDAGMRNSAKLRTGNWNASNRID